MNAPEEYPEDANAKTDVLSGEYEKRHGSFTGEKILDIGAHVGYFAERAIALGAESVIAIEPHPRNFELLTARVRALSVAPINVAAINRYGLGTLHHCDLNTGASSLFKHDGCSEKASIVRTINIGHFVKTIGFRPDFIKIDTEGAEALILSSLFEHSIKCDMAVECHDKSLYQQCKYLSESYELRFFPEFEHVGVCHILK